MAQIQRAVLNYTDSPTGTKTTVLNVGSGNVYISYSSVYSEYGFKPTLEENVNSIYLYLVNQVGIDYYYIDNTTIYIYPNTNNPSRGSNPTWSIDYNDAPVNINFEYSDILYGLKYELEFSDIDENPRKLQILEQFYQDEVKPIIGTASPCVLRYEEPNEDYSPILASNLTVNLIETDDVSYENFYTQGERQFKVILWYKDSNDVWRHYWQGFIIPDTYFQPIRTKPFNISFKAVCGLSLLKGINHTLDYSDYVRLDQIIVKAIDAIDNSVNLDFKSININTDGFAGGSPFATTYINTQLFYDENKNPISYYDCLSNIISFFNCRISLTPSKSNDINIFSTFAINNYSNITEYNDVISLKNDVKIIEDNLIKSSEGGVKTISIENDINYMDGFLNGSFQSGDTYSWLFEPSNPNVEISYDFKYDSTASLAYYNPDGLEISSLYTKLLFRGDIYRSSFEISFKYFLETTSLNGYWEIIAYKFTDSTIKRYYNFLNETWDESPGNGYFIDGLSSGSWISQSSTFRTYDAFFNDNVNLEFRFTNFDTSPSTPIYLDAFNVNITGYKDYLTEVTYDNEIKSVKRIIYNTSNNVTRTLDFSNTINSNENKTVVGSVTTGSDFINASNQPKYNRVGHTELLKPEDIVLIQRMNDTSVTNYKYEGSFRGRGNIISVDDCIAVDYNEFTESKKIVITSLEYNVKENIYDFTGYLSANYSDNDVPYNINEIYE